MWLKRKTPEPKPNRRGLICICNHVLVRTVQVLNESGVPDDPHEGVVYWAGRRIGNEAFITTCIAPAARTSDGSFATSSETNARVVISLADAQLELIGQVHSHPSELVGHSRGDDQRALMPFEGFLSVVVPNYARNGMLPLTKCGIHIFEKSHFRRLEDAEIRTRLRIVQEFTDLRKQ